MSDDEERELGWEVDRKLQQQLPIIRDAVVTGFVNDLGQRIVAGLEPQPFAYRFRVIRDPRINAFAISGGYIYVHSQALQEAGSIDELAGLLGHEIAHVHKRHYARMRQKAQLPSLATTAATLAAAVAVQDPSVFILGQAANVSLQLRYSRALESESDHFGVIFAARAGFDPTRLSRFFERILAAREMPPYLYSHPDVDQRVETVRREATGLEPIGEVPETLRQRFEPVRRRLAQLVQERRSELTLAAEFDATAGNEVLARDEREWDPGRPAKSLATLERAATAATGDPRVQFRLGERLAEAGRNTEAIEALRTTIELDPTRALVFHRLGLLYRDAGDRHRAVYAQEQAVLRSGPNTQVRKRADWELLKLTFGVAADLTVRAVPGPSAESEPAPRAGRIDSPEAHFRARITGRFLPYVDEMEIVWRAPDGSEVRRVPAPRDGRLHVSDRLAPDTALAGSWRVEISLRGAVAASVGFEWDAS